MNSTNSSNEFTKYQHLDSLTKLQDIFLEPEVVCTEKIHGTNARFGIIEGELRIGGRNMDHTNDEQGDAVMGFVGWVRENNFGQWLNSGWPQRNIIFYGEWFGAGIQKGINYGKEKRFRVFDVKLDGKYLDWDDVVRCAKAIGLPTVPVLYRGFPKLEVFNQILEIQSTVAQEHGIVDEKNTHEGIVIKPTKMKISPTTGEWLITKYKGAKWSERASEKQKKEFIPLPGSVAAFADEFVTDTRLEHVIDHLRDQGIEVKDMTATSHVLKEMNIDIIREGQDEITKITADGSVEWKQISQLVSKRTSVLLKQYLYKLMEKAVADQQKI